MKESLELRNNLPEHLQSFLEQEFLPFLQEKGFPVGSVSGLPASLLEQIRNYGNSTNISSYDSSSLAGFLTKKIPNFEIDLWRQGDLSEAYLSEVPTEARLANRDTMDEADELEMLRFSLRVLEEPAGPFMCCDDFKETLKTCTPGNYENLGEVDVQTIRRGAVLYFDEIFVGSDSDEENALLENLYNFRDHFTEPEFNQSIHLDSKMTKALWETLWFLQQIGLSPEEVSEFRETAIQVAENYFDKHREHPAKHQNNPEDNERASFFEHFLAVVRLSLGFVQSLQQNCLFTPCEFLQELLARPDFWKEISYTALLHDVIEDGVYSEEAVRKMLQEARLPESLVDQILTNLDLLNSKRTDESGARISLKNYAEEIHTSNNPVAEVVKGAGDIIHNAKSFRESSKYEVVKGARTLKDSWKTKQKIYEPLVERMFALPAHLRAKELIEVLNANSELIGLEAWRKALDKHPEKASIISGLRDYPKRKIEAVMSPSS